MAGNRVKIRRISVSVPETPENLHILAGLSAKDNLIEFCRHESFKTSTTLRLLAEFPSTVLDYLETYRLCKQG